MGVVSMLSDDESFSNSKRPSFTHIPFKRFHPRYTEIHNDSKLMRDEMTSLTSDSLWRSQLPAP